MQQLGKTIKTRLLRELKKMAEAEPERYDQFITEFGPVLKEGIAADPTARDEVLPLLRYQTSRSEGKRVSLDDYIGRMPAEQTEIYYVLAESLHAAANSPHLDPFKARGLEVLYWHEPLDLLLAQLLGEYREKPFRNAADGELELPPGEAADEPPAEPTTPEPDFNRFVGRCVTTLGNRVAEVRASRVLRDSPARLVAPDGREAELQRLYRLMGREYQAPPLILELNRDHPLIARLSALATALPESPLLPLAIEQLYAGALLQEGLHPNPSEMLPGIQALMQLAADAVNS
jgi:molecular chaperone HtpG